MTKDLEFIELDKVRELLTQYIAEDKMINIFIYINDQSENSKAQYITRAFRIQEIPIGSTGCLKIDVVWWGTRESQDWDQPWPLIDKLDIFTVTNKGPSLTWIKGHRTGSLMFTANDKRHRGLMSNAITYSLHPDEDIWTAEYIFEQLFRFTCRDVPPEEEMILPQALLGYQEGGRILHLQTAPKELQPPVPRPIDLELAIAENLQLKAKLERYEWDWEHGNTDDRPLPEDEAIEATAPWHVRENVALDMEAMRLVGAKKSKRGLVNLVRWLLVDLRDTKAELARFNAVDETS